MWQLGQNWSPQVPPANNCQAWVGKACGNKKDGQLEENRGNICQAAVFSDVDRIFVGTIYKTIPVHQVPVQ